MNKHTPGPRLAEKTVLISKRNKRKYVIDAIHCDAEIYCVRALAGGIAPYGPSQPRTIDQINRLYEVANH